MNFTPKISTVIPAYNAEHTIARAIASVISQSVPVDEIIVVDDGSQDRTSSVAQSFGESINYIYQENAGSSAARNTGIQAATGDWIAFLDSDDSWKPSKVELQREILQQHDISWISGGYENICDGHVTHKSDVPACDMFVEQGVVGDALKLLAAGCDIWTGTVMIRRSVFGELGDFDVNQRTSHDLDLWLRIAVDYPEIGWVIDSVADYEINNPSGLTTISVQQGDRTLRDFYRRAHELRLKLSGQRKRHLEEFIRRHLRTLFRDFLARGDRREARRLLADVKGIGLSVPIWLDLALRMSPNVTQPVRAGFSYTRSVLGLR